MSAFLSDFKNFISPSCDRLLFIQRYLNERGINCKILPLGNKKHVYVDFPKNQYNPSYKIKTIIAHYDRLENTPGANDNSFAVYCLLEFAVKLFNANSFHNVQIIFTDGEETSSSQKDLSAYKNNVMQLGSFALAEIFKRLNITENDIYVFDCMGRGEVPVICENNFPEGIKTDFVNKVIALENKAEEFIKKAADGRWYKLKTAFSDNAAFIANYIPCVQITMLPSREISDYLNGIIPKTWTLFHTKDDTFDSLTLPSYGIFMKLLDLISLNKTSSAL
ncbi:MAG: Zn-dependent exopeptidase M28 [Treponema sp.]|nr:Zn-dependent exopeptidase M28 [Treponema sp.]